MKRISVRNEMLKDWLPDEFFNSYVDSRAAKFLEVPVVQSFGFGDEPKDPWPGKHRYVFSWCLLDNGYAVGWNENPARGWSFPVVKVKDPEILKRNGVSDV